jgi:hypothetical protein
VPPKLAKDLLWIAQCSAGTSRTVTTSGVAVGAKGISRCLAAVQSSLPMVVGIQRWNWPSSNMKFLTILVVYQLALLWLVDW